MMSPSNRTAERLFASIKTDAGNPYMASARRILMPKAGVRRRRIETELDMVREQHRTLFEYDEAMQELFGGDFDEYFKVIENPEFLAEEAGSAEQEAFEDMFSEADDSDEGGVLFPFENDSLYRSASDWAERLHDLGHLLYDHRGVRDPDVFRVTINALLVSSKIAYAMDIDEEDLARADADVFRAETETSIRAYTLANIFLQRVRESLGRLSRKRIAPAKEWARSFAAADALAAEITSRMLALSRALHHGPH